MEVTVYGRLRAATGGKAVEIDVRNGTTVRDALETFVAAYPRIKSLRLQPIYGLKGTEEITINFGCSIRLLLAQFGSNLVEVIGDIVTKFI